MLSPPRFSSVTNGEEPLIKKRKKLSPQSTLPDDLLLSCFARVSRLYYPTLSLVSKHFRSLLATPELYQIRSLLGRTESCLYVCLHFPSTDHKPCWFTLCRRPNQTLTNDTRKKKEKKKSSEYVLAAIPVPHSPHAHWSGVVAIGYNIYNIGGSIYKRPSSSVSVLDCRSYTWREAPSMCVERNYAAVNVLDGKIYAIGGTKKCDSSSCMEVFDPKTQTWELVSSPAGVDICGSGIYKSAGLEGKVYVYGRIRGLAYEPKEGRWDMVEREMDKYWFWSLCVIENVLYSYYLGVFKWYDTKVRYWKRLKGLVGLPTIALPGYVKLADYGGKMVALWDEYVVSSANGKKMIWCAEIALERQHNEEICGKVEWCGVVLTVPKSYEFKHALAATV